MSKEDDQAGDDAPLHRTDSSAGDREAPVGDADFEAPKRPRTAAQIAAFEKARAKRAENLAKKVSKAPAPTPEPEPEPEAPPAPEPVVPPTPARRRKPRSDAGKRRGRLVRYDEEDDEGEQEVSSLPPPPYFVIV